MNVDSKQLVVSLTDHIIFAYKRLKQNQVIQQSICYGNYAVI